MDKKIIFTTKDAKLKLTEFAAANADAENVPAEGETKGKIATVKGYAITWNTLSSDRGGYKVRLMPGSARFTDPVHALYHHEWAGGPLGDTESGSLRILPPDDIGVPVEIDLPNTTNGRDTFELVRPVADGKPARMKGMSFSMVEEPKGEETEENGELIFNVTDFLCDEVTCTAVPAFASTTLGPKFTSKLNQKGNDMAGTKLAEVERDEEVKEAEKIEAAEGETEEVKPEDADDGDVTEEKEKLAALKLAEGEGDEADDVDAEDGEPVDSEDEGDDLADAETVEDDEDETAEVATKHSQDSASHRMTLHRLKLESFVCK